MYRYGSVVFTGTSGDLEASLVDLLVPRQLRYKAGGQSDAWMMQGDWDFRLLVSESILIEDITFHVCTHDEVIGDDPSLLVSD